jgi:hypothetical protein
MQKRQRQYNIGDVVWLKSGGLKALVTFGGFIDTARTLARIGPYPKQKQQPYPMQAYTASLTPYDERNTSNEK